MTAVLLAVVTLAGAAPAALRWLRVAQREHYLAGSGLRFAARWARSGPPNGMLVAAIAADVVVAFWVPLVALAGTALLAIWPVGLSLRGRTSPLRWTARLRRLAGGVAVLYGAAVGLALAAGAPVARSLAAAFAMPALVDLALAALQPVEHRLASKWVDRARRRLAEVAPLVVAITGSYGKTTTKEYVRHLLAGTHAVVASPASFNNRLGLARTVNEQLAPGTQVLVAEMGAYRRGEIAEMCAWVRPRIGVITALGPVHLERFGSLENVAAAKAEILDGAEVAVLNVDHPELAELAGRLPGGTRVYRCSAADPTADVAVIGGEVHVSGRRLGTVEGDGAHPGNVACAVAAALACGVPEGMLAGRLAGLPHPDHRASVVTGGNGVLIIDDTYNSNPAGAKAALDLVASLSGPDARSVVVTPGMVELGPRQHDENVAFAKEAAGVADDLVVVGRTNRGALLEGAGGAVAVTVLDDRDAAVAWVGREVGAGDVVLYENDLPDHYP